MVQNGLATLNRPKNEEEEKLTSNIEQLAEAEAQAK